MNQQVGLVLLICLISINCINAQEFEGHVEYVTSYISKSDKFSVEFLEEELGTRTITYFSRGRYKSLCKSRFMSLQIFDYKKSRIYYQHLADKDTVRFNSSLAKKSQIFEYELFENTDTLMGKVCNKLVVQDNYGSKTYYYSSDYFIDPKYYENFTASNKYEILKIMQSVYLRFVLDHPDFIVDFRAKEVVPHKLKKSFFRISKKKVLKEDNY